MKRFRIRYSVDPIPAVWDTTCSTPIVALNQFHRHVQLQLGKNPDEYVINGLSEVYNTDPTGASRGLVVESQFDLPTSANPKIVLTDATDLIEETPTMAFYNDIPVKEVNHETIN